jgi:hypothetical protein
MEGRIYSTLKNAYSKAIGGDIEPIQELDEECTQSNVQTGSQTDHMVSNKRGTPPTKELCKSKSREILVNKSKENYDYNSNPKPTDQISEFNIGLKSPSIVTSPQPVRQIRSPIPVSKSQTNSNNFTFSLMGRSGVNENMKFSFKKPDDSHPQLDNSKIFVSNKVSNSLMHQTTQTVLDGNKAVKSLNRSNTNEHLSFKDSVSKSSSLIPNKSKDLAQRKLFKSEKVFIDKSLKIRDKGQGFFNRKITFAIPNFTSLLKQSKEATQAMTQTNYSIGPKHEDKSVHILFQKSREKISRDVSANSKSSKGSNENDSGFARMTKERKNKSYLDLRSQPPQALHRSSTLKVHKV